MSWTNSIGISEGSFPVGLLDGEGLGKGDSVGGLEGAGGDAMVGPDVGCRETPLGFGVGFKLVRSNQTGLKATD